MTDKTRVAILGCGPSGLLAAHAANLAGHPFDIYSVYRPSAIGGAQFLHRPIPDLTSFTPDGLIEMYYSGKETEYARKVYRDSSFKTSWGSFNRQFYIWNLRRAYATLWKRYEEKIIDTKLMFSNVDAILRTYGWVFSSVPLNTICGEKSLHTFKSQGVNITQEEMVAPGSILYNGDPQISWYRASNIFGVPGCEYPGNYLPFEDFVQIEKPLENDCSCFPEMIRIGRYGKWEKGELTHHAFENVTNALL